MSVSIDELCEELGVKEIPPANYKGLPTSHPKYATRLDGFALPTHKVIAPIVAQRLEETPRALEIGVGTGFRLIYYALNNPETEFIGVDYNRSKLKSVRRRIDSLGIGNIKLRSEDIYKVQPKEWRFPAVIAIDCVSKQAPADFYGSYSQFVNSSIIYFSKLVEQSNPNAFLVMTAYGPLVSEYRDYLQQLTGQVGMSKVQAFPFSYKKQGKDLKKGTVIFAS